MEVAVVVVGAEQYTALHRTLPAVFRLTCSGRITRVRVVAVTEHDEEGNVRGQEELCKAYRERLEPNLGAGDHTSFLSECFAIAGDTRDAGVAEWVRDKLSGFSRVLLCFVPPIQLKPGDSDVLAAALAPQCADGWLRCVIEKPTGHSRASAATLADSLAKSFNGEENVFRLDHFLGKEMVQCIIATRFANRFLEPSWNNNHINAVVISCREAKLVRPGRFARYFDEYGIVREIFVDHLLHMLALVAMETPVSLADPNSLRDEIAKVLRCVRPADLDDMVLAQYNGYKTVNGVSSDSVTPTFATCVLYIDNPRWHGVPFILKAGKGMYERRTDIRIQFKPPHNRLFPASRGGGPQNELVIRVQPNSDIYMKMMRKLPGARLSVALTKLDLLSADSGSMLDMLGTNDLFASPDEDSLGPPAFNAYKPDSYERLLFDVIKNDPLFFTRRDELEALWSVFDPALSKLDADPARARSRIVHYDVGSQGPAESYALMKAAGFAAFKLESEILGAKTQPVMHRLLQQFHLTAFQMEETVSNFQREFSRGLAGDPESTIKMLPSFVTKVPDGTERGIYYALDLGGTNFRVTRYLFDGKGGVDVTNELKFTIPDNVMTSDKDELFNYIASCVASIYEICDEKERNFKFGFTFSFPVDQTAINAGSLIKWTKGFTATGVVGNDIVKLLQLSLRRVALAGEIVALVNDTVGTLVSSAYVDPATMIGVILGTGTNAAYRERVENIRKLPKEIRDRGGEMVINTEWGNFGSVAGQLPVSDIDVEIDRHSRNRGEQIFEKMISGMYLGEMVRLALVQLHDAGEIWSGKSTTVSDLLRQQHAFESRFMSDIEYDMSDQLLIVERVERAFGVENSTLGDRAKLKEVCGMVVQRAAKLTACAIAATLRQIGPDRANGCTVGVDGSVYQHHPSFRQRLTQALGALGARCNVVLAKDGSGRGSALVACAVVPK